MIIPKKKKPAVIPDRAIITCYLGRVLIGKLNEIANCYDISRSEVITKILESQVDKELKDIKKEAQIQTKEPRPLESVDDVIDALNNLGKTKPEDGIVNG